MRIIYFHQHFSTPDGAVGIRSYEMAKKLVAKGHQVTMVCGSYSGGNTGLTCDFDNGQRQGIVNGIEVIEFQLNYANSQNFFQRVKAFASYAFKSIKLALTLNYDVVFATTTPLTAAIPGIAARWLRRKHFIFEVRDLWPELPKAMGVIKNPIILGLMSILEWLAYKSAHGHIALSPGIQQGIKRHLSHDKHIALIPNGCDLNLFQAQADEWQPEGVNDGDLLALFAGTHGQANGLENVLDVALALKSRDIKNIKLVFIGQGKLKSALVKKAEALELNNVIFLDPVNKNKLAKLMSRADVGLQVLANIPEFYYGTSPNKFFDYLSAGLPVLNNYPGWVAELIEDNHCGIAVPAQNPLAFADALCTFRNEVKQRKLMSDNAHKLATTHFDRDLLSDQFVDYIEESYKQHA